MNKTAKNILVVDDEPMILEVVCSLLESKGYQVTSSESGKQALELFDTNNFSLVLLDLMLPDISGEEVCKTIRKKSRVPIIMLTAKVDEEDIVDGLFLGADDYITKPFGLKELSARIEAVLRRTQHNLPLVVRNSWGHGDLMIDFEKNIIQKKGHSIMLTPREWNILSALIKYPGKVFTREELIELALKNDFEGYDRAIDSHIKNIRQKIEEDPKNPIYVVTVHGLGYKFGGE